MFKRSYLTIWVALILTVLFSQTLCAATPEEESTATEPGILSIQTENDGMSQDVDGYYTYGSRFSYLSNQEPWRWLIRSAQLFPFFKVAFNTSHDCLAKWPSALLPPGLLCQSLATAYILLTWHSS